MVETKEYRSIEEVYQNIFIERKYTYTSKVQTSGEKKRCWGRGLGKLRVYICAWGVWYV